MRTFLLRRLPWLAALLAACGDDTQTPSDEGSSSSGPTSSETGIYSDTGIDFTESSSGTESSSSGESSSSSEAVDSSESSSSGPPNIGPTAMDDEYFALQGTLLDVAGSGVIENDVDPESDPLVVTSFDAVSVHGGTVDVDSTGAFTYTSAPGFFGIDTFDYAASDESSSAVGHVTVHVAPVRAQLADVEAGVGGFVIDGGDASGRLGYAVAGMGDIDGDGLADVLVSAPYGADPYSSRHSYVVFGKSDHDTITHTELEAGSGGWAIEGPFDSAAINHHAANAGDVNGDGVADMLLGYPFAEQRGRVHLVYGKTDTELVEIADVDAGIGGLTMVGDTPYAGAGTGVAGLGDLDADGYADFAVGSPGLDDGLGGAYVVFGAAMLDVTELADVGDGVRGFVLHGPDPLESTGYAVAGVGDVNGDGIGDLAVGAPGHYDPISAAQSYVVFGKVDDAPVSLGTLGDDDAGFILVGYPNGTPGMSIAGIGDLDGDGLDDLVIGDPSLASGGRAYVVFGKSDSAPVDLAVNGEAGFAIMSEDGDDSLGLSVSGAGDVNGDGRGDVIIGAWEASPNGQSGSAYVVYGDDTRADIELEQVALGNGGFAIDGAMADDQAGFAVGGPGDIDGDGLADVVVGAPGAADEGGRAYVVFGVRTAPP